MAAAGLAAVVALPGDGRAQEAAPLKERHIGVQRARAASAPRSEADQALIDGWPLYRTERGQAAFNDAMATLKATDGAAPAAKAFEGCPALECNLTLPRIGGDGWIPSGRLWVSPSEYVLFVHSPRLGGGSGGRRRASVQMRYFVYHEFHNSTRNNDTFDTISSHSGSVFVPFYLSKQGTDARGRRFVIVVQVAPYDVMSIHATNFGSLGPGVEVAKNAAEQLEPLQGTAGVVLGIMVKAAAPHLQVVNHRGNEGLPMLQQYQRRLAALRSRPAVPTIALPFVPAPAPRVAAATGRLDELIVRRGLVPRRPPPELRATIAEPVLVQPKQLAVRPGAVPTATPALVEPPRLATRPVSQRQ